MKILFTNDETKYFARRLTLQERRANEKHFEFHAKITKMYVWNDYGECMAIEDNKYICNQRQAILLIKITTPQWFKKNVIVKK